MQVVDDDGDAGGDRRRASVSGERERLTGEAQRILRLRSKRLERFGPDLFGEPAWEILLLLYVAEGGCRQKLDGLAPVIGGSTSSTARWVDHLERKRLVRRETHPTDTDVAFVELTDQGRHALEAFLLDAIALGRQR